uniref:Uncharacterized protein n=1 Tax=Ixodes ricinus TaxID=34613 RepID=A0A6B0U1X8_IXORI
MNPSLPFLMHITLILKLGIIYGETLVFLPMCSENASIFFFQKKWRGKKKKKQNSTHKNHRCKTDNAERKSILHSSQHCCMSEICVNYMKKR